MEIETAPVRVAFGTFEADLSTGELWRGGFRIKLQGQPFRVLSELVRHPGQVVSREQLQQRVWDKGTNVDFEHSLGTAINKVREALGDSAENPRFVETMPRRGYRFIAPVTVLDLPVSLSMPPSSELAPAVEAEPTVVIESPADQAPLTVAPLIASATSDLAALDRTYPILPGAHAASIARWLWFAVPLLLLACFICGYVLRGRNAATPLPALRQLTHTERLLPGGDAQELFPVTVTDGTELFASVLHDGGVHLERISIAGGGIQPLTLPDEVAGPAIADISHDHMHLLVRSHASNESEQPLFIVPVAGGSAERLTHVLAHDATWMPDDRSILYAAGDELFEASLSGATPKHHASLPGRAFWLRWSPDGKTLRFTLFDPLAHTQSLWEIKAGDRRAHPVLGSWATSRDVCCGNWFPDGSGFVFQTTDGAVSDLWLLRGTHTNPVRLTDGPLAYQGPVTASTGHTIFMTGASDEGRVQLLHPGAHDFVPFAGFYSNAHRVEETRDGAWIAWMDADGRLWRARPDGSELLQLTPSNLNVFNAHWSPDGSRLALMARLPTGTWSIYQVLVDGSDLQALLETRSNDADPTWSPDGRQLAFGKTPDLLGKDSAPRSIQILNLDSRQITTVPGSENLFSPRWSPDGRYLAALSMDQKELRLYDTTMQHWSVLAHRSAADPVWSRDSRSIYADAFMEPGQPIYRVEVPTGHVTQLGGIQNSPSNDLSDLIFCGVLHDGTIAVRGRLSTANLYALHLPDAQ